MKGSGQSSDPLSILELSFLLYSASGLKTFVNDVTKA